MPEFLPVAQVGELTDPGKMCLEIQDRFVVLVHLDGQYYCIDDVCTHDGGTLGEGEISNHCLVCPRHGAKFDISTGKAVTMPATEPTKVHHVRIEGQQICVSLCE